MAPENPPVTTSRPTLVARMSAACLLMLGAGMSGACTPSTEKAPALPTPAERAAAVPMQSEEFSRLGYRVDWRGFATMLPGSTVRFMDVLGDVVAVQESAGVLSVLEVKNGATRWSDQVSSSLSKYIGNVRDNDRLISSTDAEAFFYDIATGSLKARQRLSIVSDQQPVKVGDILVYGSDSGQVLGHLTLNGFRQWGASLNGAIESDPLPLKGGRVALVSRGGDVVILDGTTGLIETKAQIFSGSEAPIAASDDLLFVASTDHSLYAIAKRDGAIVWRVRTDAPLRQPPVFHDGKIYCDMGKDGLAAFDAGTGKRLWNNPDAKGRIIGVRGKRLLGFDGSSAYLLDPAKGATVETVKLTGITMLKTDGFVDGTLYAASPTGVIARLVTK
jgi:outer membrane protein assembly factor BamB